jgi:hypothetical protein
MSYQPDPYAQQDVYAQQQQLARGDANVSPGAYPPPPSAYAQSGAYPPPPSSYSQPGAYPPVQQPYGQQYYAQPRMRAGNPWANRALYSGIVSIVLSLVTLWALVGFAGVITGTFAIVRGITALNRANYIPGNPGRGQAIAAIILGILAWVIVIISFVLRAGDLSS